MVVVRSMRSVSNSGDYFQKELSLQNFLNKDGNEKKCSKALFQSKMAKWLAMSTMWCQGILYPKGLLPVSVQKLSKSIPLISGTIFSSTKKLPLTIGFFLYHSIKRRSGLVNPHEFTQVEKEEQEIAESCNRLIKNCI